MDSTDFLQNKKSGIFIYSVSFYEKNNLIKIRLMNLKDLNKMTATLSNTRKMPVLFLGHGSPMNVIEENEFV